LPDHARYLGYRSDPSNVDLLGDLDRIIDLDAERTVLDLGMSSWRPSVAQRVTRELHDHFMIRNGANLL